MARVAAQVFVDDLSRLQLRDSDAHHLAKVLRLRPGEAVTASDGRGGVLGCRWDGTSVVPAPGAVASYDERPGPEISVALALTKGDHPEWAVQKLTETGVDRVVVLVSERCVARWPAAAVPRQMARLQEVARQASMQSRRSWLPDLQGPVNLRDLVAASPEAALSLAVPGAGPVSLTCATLLIGPEGGWTEAELAAVPRHVGLGPHVLRAETAAVVAGALLAALRSGLVLENPVLNPGGDGRQRS
jgi:16S rRNA (uracil1498-N3)-methyltransferase